MSTGKRLAKRSIVGTKVVVLREDGLYYPGVIQAVKTAEVDPSKGQCVSITKYAVRSMMEPIGGQPHTGRQQPQLREYSEVDLIGPGFQSTAGLTLQPGQKVFVTFTGREVAGHVTKHRPDVDEVHISLQASNANTVEIVKRMEEVRLMESRKSARLMDHHDVDFARLAEGGSTASPTITAGSVPNGSSSILYHHSDLMHQQHQLHHQLQPARKRCSSASTSGIDVPGAFIGSRKRRSSPNSSGFATDSASTCSTMMDDDGEDSDQMDECAAAMVLMRLSCSPHSPRWEELAAWQSNQSSTSSSSGAFSWRGSVSSSGDSPPHAVVGSGSVASRAATNASAIAAGSSGVGRKLKFRSATPSPPLMSGSAPAAYAGNLLARFRAASSSTTTTSVATIGPDDGIASDESISECDEGHSPSSSQVRTITTYQCTFPGCSTTTRNCAAIESHVRNSHLGPRKDDDEISDHEEEFYYTEVEEDVEEDMLVADHQNEESTQLAKLASTWHPSRPATADGQQQQPTTMAAYLYSNPATVTTNGFTATSHPGWMASSPPTLSHMDMARPPHEDPEYQRALVMQMKAARPIAIPARVRSISWSSGYGYGSNQLKQAKVTGSGSPGSKTSSGAAGAANALVAVGGVSPVAPTSGFSVKSSPVRRPRGEAKKCRKVYGMEHREQWCTQCKWKKACTRFGD